MTTHLNNGNSITRNENPNMSGRPEKMFDADFKSALEYLSSDEISLSPTLLFAFSDLTRPELQQFARVWQTLPADKRHRITRQ